MQATLDARKREILRAVIRSYIETAEPVGSEVVAHQGHLGVSAATIRNEMAALEELGYLAQPHPSAGRIPTDRGYRAYVDQLADTDAPLSTGERLRLRRRLATAVQERERIPKEAARTLANVTKYTSLVAHLEPDRFVFHLEGAANILIQPEFRDARAARPILEALEREEVIAGLLEAAPEQQVSVTIGSEHRVEDLRGCSVVAAAYRVLSDPERRAQYNRFGTVQPVPAEDVAGGGFGPFNDIFDMFFGRRSSRVDRDAPEAGADLRYDLELSLEEAATSVEKTIEIERLETCPRCFGTGAERGSAPERCPTCGGRGEV